MQAVTEALRAELESLLNESVSSVRQREATAFDQSLARFDRRVVLFGAGNLGRRVARVLVREGYSVQGFADNQSSLWGTDLDGIPVLSPANAGLRYGGSATFMVTIWNADHLYVETFNQLKALGCEHVVPVSQFRWKYHEEFLPFFFEDVPHQIVEQAGPIQQAFSLWSEDRSRQEFVRHLRWQIEGAFEHLPPLAREESYFPDDLFRLNDDEVFVDCGAFNGDTIEAYRKRKGSAYRQIIAIEPDPANLKRLRSYVATLPEVERQRIRVEPCAVSDKREKVRFNADGTVGAAISDAGALEVECAPLDEILKGLVPSHIKMDIEGAEPSALKGAARLIRDHQPILSVCVYHRQDHVWSIPNLIHELHPGYSLFLRHHEPDGWQVVCYAIPQHRLNDVRHAR